MGNSTVEFHGVAGVLIDCDFGVESHLAMVASCRDYLKKVMTDVKITVKNRT